MIEINLLPLEMRKVDHTSLRRLLCMVAAVVLLSGSMIALVLCVKSYRFQSSENVVATADVQRLEPVAKEYDVLAAELKNIETRIQTIEDIRATRMRWGRKLDELYAVLPEYVWFDKMELKTSKAVAANGASATLILQCYLAGADEKKYSEFRRRLTGELVAEGPYTGRDFIRDFQSLGYSGWTREDFKDTEEGVALKFDLDLPVKSLVQVPVVQPVKRPVVAAK